MIPSVEEALGIHAKYGSNGRIVEHCKTVALGARILAEEFKRKGKQIDEDSVVAAAMLHDLGRSRVQNVSHGIVGAQILKKEGVDSKVVEIVRRHVGAGISPDEAERLGLGEFDLIPRSLEERVVCFADKMVDGTRIRDFDAEVKRFIAKSHDVERLRALKQGLETELGEDPEKVILDKIKESQPKAAK